MARESVRVHLELSFLLAMMKMPRNSSLFANWELDLAMRL